MTQSVLLLVVSQITLSICLIVVHGGLFVMPFICVVLKNMFLLVKTSSLAKHYSLVLCFPYCLLSFSVYSQFLVMPFLFLSTWHFFLFSLSRGLNVRHVLSFTKKQFQSGCVLTRPFCLIEQ